MKRILYLLVFFGIFKIAFSAEPVANVPQLPGNLEPYTDSEEMYFDKLMEYYIPALMLETQLKLMNVTPKSKVPLVSSTMLSNMDPKYFKQYNKIAFELYAQIKDLPMDVIDKQLANSETENKMLKKENTKLMIDTIGAHKNKELYEMLLASIDQTISANKSLEQKYVLRIKKLLSELSDVKYNANQCLNSNPSFVLTISPFAEQFFNNNSQINSVLSPGILGSMSVLRISKDVGIINIWGKYTFITSDNKNRNGYFITYKEDMWSFGGDFEVNLTKLMNEENFSWSFKIGAGYFKGYVKTPNLALAEQSYHGNLIKLETDFYNFSQIFPFGIVIGANFNKYSTDLIYSDFLNEINLGSPWVPSIYMGLKFNLLQIY